MEGVRGEGGGEGRALHISQFFPSFILIIRSQCVLPLPSPRIPHLPFSPFLHTHTLNAQRFIKPSCTTLGVDSTFMTKKNPATIEVKTVTKVEEVFPVEVRITYISNGI